jgi:hypothetical protein
VGHPDLYHRGNRALQDEFGSRDLADRLESLARTEFSPSDVEFICSQVPDNKSGNNLRPKPPRTRTGSMQRKKMARAPETIRTSRPSDSLGRS